MFRHFKKFFLIFVCLSKLLPLYAMENRDIYSNTIYIPLLTRIFPLLATFLFYKYNKHYRFQNAVLEVIKDKSTQENLKIITKCIKDGVDPNYKMLKNKRTGLMLAALFSNEPLFDCLIQNGANPNSIDPIGFSPFFHLIDGLQKNPETFNAKIFKYLLTYTNNAQITIENRSITPLFAMCMPESNIVLKQFIKHGLDVNKQDSLGNTPLRYAISLQNLTAIKEFCHAGASITINDEGNTAFHIAAGTQLPKEHVIALLTFTRYDSYNENQKEKERKVLAVFSALSTLPRELRFFILNKLTLVDNDYCFNKKLCKKLFIIGYKKHIINHVNKRIQYIDNILRIKNNEGKIALDYLHATQDMQYIQEVKSLFNNTQFKNDLASFKNASAHKHKIPENNLIGKMFRNCVLLLKD